MIMELCDGLPTSHEEAAKDPRIRKYDNMSLDAWLDSPEVKARPRLKAATKTASHALLGVENNEMPMSYLMHYAATAGKPSRHSQLSPPRYS